MSFLARAAARGLGQERVVHRRRESLFADARAAQIAPQDDVVERDVKPVADDASIEPRRGHMPGGSRATETAGLNSASAAPQALSIDVDSRSAEFDAVDSGGSASVLTPPTRREPTRAAMPPECSPAKAEVPPVRRDSGAEIFSGAPAEHAGPSHDADDRGALLERAGLRADETPQAAQDRSTQRVLSGAVFQERPARQPQSGVQASAAEDRPAADRRSSGAGSIDDFPITDFPRSGGYNAARRSEDELTINVSIGTIEVARPQLPVSPAPTKRSRPMQPSLAEYMEVRRRIRDR